MQSKVLQTVAQPLEPNTPVHSSFWAQMTVPEPQSILVASTRHEFLAIRFAQIQPQVFQPLLVATGYCPPHLTLRRIYAWEGHARRVMRSRVGCMKGRIKPHRQRLDNSTRREANAVPQILLFLFLNLRPGRRPCPRPSGAGPERIHLFIYSPHHVVTSNVLTHQTASEPAGTCRRTGVPYIWSI